MPLSLSEPGAGHRGDAPARSTGAVHPIAGAEVRRPMTSGAEGLEARIAASETLLAQLEDTEGTERQVADTLFKQGYLLGEAGRPEEAIACFEAIVARF